jgi:hypothetical protein
MDAKQQSILIAIPSRTETCPIEAACSLAALVGYTTQHLPNVKLNVARRVCDDIALGRKDLVEAAVCGDFDYIFFLDDDMVVPPYSLVTLCQMNTDIISGLGFLNDFERPAPSMFMQTPRKYLKPDQKINYIPVYFYFKAKAQLIEVDAVGLFCCLIKANVFQEIAKKNDTLVDWFNPFQQDGAGEDLSFCKRAKDAGFRIIVHLGIKCGHIPKSPPLIDEKMYLKGFSIEKYFPNRDEDPYSGIPIAVPEDPRLIQEVEELALYLKEIEEENLKIHRPEDERASDIINEKQGAVTASGSLRIRAPKKDELMPTGDKK